MTAPLGRRAVTASLAAGAAAAALRPAGRLGAAAAARAVVVGGGFAGATAAKYLRLADPTISVTLVTGGDRFVTCPFSNLVLAGLRELDAITWDYAALAARHGIAVVPDRAIAVDPAGRTVRLAEGGLLPYERLVLAPGIDMDWYALDRYDAAAAEEMPHAWQAGAQTALLRRQIEAMPEGGLFVMTVPAPPYRCPPGPYERASLVAHYLKTHKPRAKLLILDAKESFSKQTLFMDGWARHYPGLIEWVSGPAGGAVIAVDPAERAVVTAAGDRHRGDVVNVIPPQRAAALAAAAGLTDAGGWCPVDHRTMQSRRQGDIHVLGDASIGGAMPKSAFAAAAQAKVAAAAVAALLRGEAPADPVFLNVCYSFLTPGEAVSVAGVYRPGEDGIAAAVSGAGGESPREAGPGLRAAEAAQAADWYRAITADAFS